MKRIIGFVISIVLCQYALGQDRYVYDKVGTLNYVVSDTLKSGQHVVGDVFAESSKTQIGSYVAYTTNKSYLILDGQFKHISTTYEPEVFNSSISRNSLNSLIAWLHYVKENHGTQDSSVQYTFVDESLKLRISILKPYNWWCLVCKEKEYRIDLLDSLIPNLEKLALTIKEKQNEYNL